MPPVNDAGFADPFAESRPRVDANTPFGEVIESSTTRFRAQCPRERLYSPPLFGAYVKVLPVGAPSPKGNANSVGRPEDPFADVPTSSALPPDTPDGTVYALVFGAATGSSEPGRRPSAYGLAEEQLQEEQPQIFDLLATEFVALPIGYTREGQLVPSVPPRPPRLHAFVWGCSSAEICALSETPDFVRPLLALPGEANPDDLIAASIREAYLARDKDFGFLVRIGKRLALLLRQDPERLTALLRKLEP